MRAQQLRQCIWGSPKECPEAASSVRKSLPDSGLSHRVILHKVDPVIQAQITWVGVEGARPKHNKYRRMESGRASALINVLWEVCMNEDWKVLSEAVSREHDPQKLLELVERLNRALEERERELKDKHSSNDAKSELQPFVRDPLPPLFA